MKSKDGWIDYEAFGATGDGVTDDLPAICKAHEYANEHGLGVRTKPDATYHLGTRALTAVVATSTDWNTSRFTIDGPFVDDANTPEDYQGMYYFTDPDDGQGGDANASPSEDRPFPYAPCGQVKVRGLETASGKKPRISPNAKMAATTIVIEEG